MAGKNAYIPQGEEGSRNSPWGPLPLGEEKSPHLRTLSQGGKGERGWIWDDEKFMIQSARDGESLEVPGLKISYRRKDT